MNPALTGEFTKRLLGQKYDPRSDAERHATELARRRRLETMRARYGVSSNHGCSTIRMVHTDWQRDIDGVLTRYTYAAGTLSPLILGPLLCEGGN